LSTTRALLNQTHTHAGATAKFKPNAKRLEMSIPLDTESDNYTDSQDEYKRIASLDLRCACAAGVPPPSTH
jgi:hypothetical protein